MRAFTFMYVKLQHIHMLNNEYEIGYCRIDWDLNLADFVKML